MNAASIVLFNPDIVRLSQNINSIINQVDKVILIDNGNSQKAKSQLSDILSDAKVVYLDNGGNKGIASALNRAVEHCVKENINWLLTLDQDSICPSNLIETYEKYISLPDVSVICCTVSYNEQEIVTATKAGETYTYIQECITSASYINIQDCLFVGGFDETMFIDRVDFEYCYRIIKLGKKILQTNEITLDHQLGNLKLKNVGGSKIHIGGHSAFRKFYMAQNLVYCYRKHPEFNSLWFCISKEIKLLVKTVIYEDDKIEKTSAIFRGILKGVLMKKSADAWISTEIRRKS